MGAGYFDSGKIGTIVGVLAVTIETIVAMRRVSVALASGVGSGVGVPIGVGALTVRVAKIVATTWSWNVLRSTVGS